MTSDEISIRDPNTNEKFVFSFADICATDEMIAITYRMLCRYLATKSLSYAFTTVELFRDLIRSAFDETDKLVSCIDLAAIESWRVAREARGARFDAAMAFIVPWLRRWVESENDGVSDEVSIYLNDTKGSVEGRQYVALRTNDPERGALTQNEMNALTRALNDHYEIGLISLSVYALLWLFIGTGIRPIQVARMRVSDVHKDEIQNSKDVYLAIPLAKGQEAYEGQRWKMRAPTVVAEVLLAYLDHYCLGDPTGPLFPSAKNRSMPASSNTLQGIVQRLGKQLNVFTSRLEAPITLFPYRFRYTVGTRAVELGANDHVVARLLTHRTTWSIKHYRAATAAGQRTIIAELGYELETIAKAFRGAIVTDLSDATRAGEAQALIRDFERLSGRSMGACGTRVECLQLAPIACLTCRHFEAFEDAPFEELRASLKAEQDEEGELKIRQIYDEPIAALDDLIQLVRCEGLSRDGVRQ
ncbi:site-specific integrase [Ralstonia pseudosolanacearum]|uniref:tyrosine-type recombinase/integrase n=2 Tax=Ralstonia pseudosolanacearum TaxID=1310165 RepID=UPI0013C2EEC4|nr:tyrosine-type recombinase/integrase [Ralstonia pseudosolanacearum]UYR06753.1 site-specific integrase [Ralstonia pseudosolanacearum]